MVAGASDQPAPLLGREREQSILKSFLDEVAAHGQALDFDVFAPAVEAQIVDVDLQMFRFRHPLIRSAVAQSAGVGGRRRVHEALAILVGHSYGGAVITEAGRHERVAGLVYIAAFAPDAGESVSTLLAGLPPGGPVPPILPPQDGFLFLDREKFAASFAADLSAADAAFMADSQVPWGVEALDGKVSEPAWQSQPAWYMVTTEDRMIPPPLQRKMAERAGATVVEEAGSHSIYVSRPGAVARLVGQAARQDRTVAATP